MLKAILKVKFYLLFLLLFIVIVISGVHFLSPGLLSRLFFPLPQIANTEVIVKQTKNILQVYSQSYYDEFVKKVTIDDQVVLVLIAKTKIYAGYDLKSHDLAIKLDNAEKTIGLKLPKPEILDIVINPSDCEVFLKKRGYALRPISEYIVEIKRELRERAIEKGLLIEAEKQGKLVMKNFFYALGYSKVIVY